MSKLHSEKIIDIWSGEYRVFFNFYKNGDTITLGFPKPGSSANDVYFKINQNEQPRISIYEAKRYLNQGMISMLRGKVKGLGYTSSEEPKLTYGSGKSAYSSGNSSSHRYGYCTRCDAKLSGDRSKKLCYKCWKSDQ